MYWLMVYFLSHAQLITTENSENGFPTFLFFQNLESQNTPIDINWSVNEVHVDAVSKKISIGRGPISWQTIVVIWTICGSHVGNLNNSLRSYYQEKYKPGGCNLDATLELSRFVYWLTIWVLVEILGWNFMVLSLWHGYLCSDIFKT